MSGFARRIIYNMKFNNYLEKLRQKPVKEKERLAIAATAVAFLIFFGIWMLTFSESSKQIAPEQSSSTINDQMGDLKNSMDQGKQSIQDMMQNLPQNSVDLSNPGQDQNMNANNPTGSQNQDLNINQENHNPPVQSPNENNSPAPNNNGQQNDQNSQNPPQNNLPSGGNLPQLP